MRKYSLLILITAMFCTILPASLTAGPFDAPTKSIKATNISGNTSSPSKAPVAEKKLHIKPTPTIFPGLTPALTSLQRTLKQTLSDFATQIKTKPSLAVILLSFLFAFLYGIIHALGPGHGKIFTLTYFMSEKPEPKKGILLGIMVAFMHGGMAILLVLIINGVLSSFFKTQQAIDNISPILQLISYGLIGIMGCVLLVMHILENIKHSKTKNAPEEKQKSKTMKSPFAMALAIGLVPCPGTTILLLFALSQGILGFGVVLALFPAAGMAVTITIVGLSVIFVKKGAYHFLKKHKGTVNVIESVLEIGGSAVIMLIGTFLFIASLSAPVTNKKSDSTLPLVQITQGPNESIVTNSPFSLKLETINGTGFYSLDEETFYVIPKQGTNLTIKEYTVLMLYATNTLQTTSTQEIYYTFD